MANHLSFWLTIRLPNVDQMFHPTAQPGVGLVQVAAALSVSDMVCAVRQHLPGELAKHGIVEGHKAVTRFDKSFGGKSDKDPSASCAAGLQFCVERTIRKLWQQMGAHGDADSLSDTAAYTAVFVAAVIEYMCAELVELAGNAARDNRKSTIGPRHIYLGVWYDEELQKKFKDFAFCGGGVLPVSVVAAPSPSMVGLLRSVCI